MVGNGVAGSGGWLRLKGWHRWLAGFMLRQSDETIRAEVVGYDELIAAGGSMAAVREKGQFRLEGKDYVVLDGEICHFRFNVAK